MNLKNKTAVVMTVFATAFAVSSSFASSARVERILSAAEGIGISEDKLSELRLACEEYELAESRLVELSNLHGLNRIPKRENPITADLVDPTIRKIQEQARKCHNRFEVLKRTQQKWGPSTNLLARAARQSMQSRLNETRAERDAAKEFEKQVKELQKAAKKDAKNLDKLRKDLEKYRNKAETDGFRETCERLLDILPTTN